MTRSQILLAAVFAVLGAAFLTGVWASVSLLWAGAGLGLISIVAYLNVRVARLTGKGLWELRGTMDSLSAELSLARKSADRSLNLQTNLENAIARCSKEVRHQREAAHSGVRLMEALLVEQASILRKQELKLTSLEGAVLDSESELKNLAESCKTMNRDLALLASATKQCENGMAEMADVGRQLLQKCDGIIANIPQITGKLEEIREHLPVEQRIRRNFERASAKSSMETVQAVEALMQLGWAYDHSFGPLLGGWAMDPVTLHGILKIVRGKPQPRIVELGSGTSTIWLARALAKMGEGQLISFEHQLTFAESVRGLLKAERLSDRANVVHAPLQRTTVGKQEFDWYSLKDVTMPATIDVLLVDGPPGAIGQNARYPAVPILQTRLALGSVVILDDTDRKDEVEALAAWAEIDGLRLSEPEPLGPRAALFTVLGTGAHG